MTSKIQITNQEQRCLDLLNDLYKETLTPKTFSLSRFCSGYKIHKGITKILNDNKLIKIVDVQGVLKTYLWNTTKPNINTARKIISIMRAQNKVYNDAKLADKKKQQQEVKRAETVIEVVKKPKTITKIIKEEKKALKEFSLMWGLLRFKW